MTENVSEVTLSRSRLISVVVVAALGGFVIGSLLSLSRKSEDEYTLPQVRPRPWGEHPSSAVAEPEPAPHFEESDNDSGEPA